MDEEDNGLEENGSPFGSYWSFVERHTTETVKYRVQAGNFVQSKLCTFKPIITSSVDYFTFISDSLSPIDLSQLSFQYNDIKSDSDKLTKAQTFVKNAMG